MRWRQTTSIVLVLFVLAIGSSRAQGRQQAAASVPRLIPISGTFQPADGQPAAAVEIVRLAIYSEETGGTALWQEVQTVSIDAAGRYILLLGAASSEGLPLDMFASGDARWLGVAFERPGEVEGPRRRLTSVPYALRAADADTLGGRPASAYQLAPTADGRPAAARTTEMDSTAFPTVSAINNGIANRVAKYLNNADTIGFSEIEEVNANVSITGGTGTGVAPGVVPVDRLNVRFTNANGAITGISLRNDGATNASYSGMLFYDHTGNLGQFQGFNNVTHEYRINNIARTSGVFDGSINFMLNSTSRFRVRTDGRIDLSTGGTISGGSTTGARGQATGWRPVGAFDPNPLFIESGTPGDGAGLYLDGDTAVLWSPGDLDILRIYDEDDLTTPHNPSVTVPRFVLTNFGDIRIGEFGLGCVQDSDNTIIAGTCASDERLKTDIRPFGGDILARALQLRPVYYHWRTEMAPRRLAPVSGEAYGLIAQEVEQLFPDMVKVASDGFKTVDYGKLQYILLEALKEEHTRVQSLEAKVQTLESRLARLETAAAARWNLSAGTWLLLAPLGLLAIAYRRRR